jgi:bifunctional UDP-N-acetylglucosamine pyrophosphorylase / glucosamine-1-phosphate N-acetyltransferase
MGSGRVLIIPAAGLGTRLNADGPKALFPIDGRPMIDHLFQLYEPFVSGFVLVLHPSFETAVRRHCDARGVNVYYARQDTPTGMLDAILSPIDLLRDLECHRIWVTWCDQIAVHPMTVRTLDRHDREDPLASVILPTAWRRDPYIHIEREPGGGILEVRHRREGDAMPELGESDMGLFSLACRAYFEEVPEFASEGPGGSATGERNFLPFIPWVCRRGGRVRTFACRDPREAIGVNDAQDARAVEAYLAERGAARVE